MLINIIYYIKAIKWNVINNIHKYIVGDRHEGGKGY